MPRATVANQTREEQLLAQATKLHTKITEDTAKYNTLVEEINTLKAARALLDSLNTGQIVTGEFGRAEKKRVVTGEVIGTTQDEKRGLLVKVLVGKGFDAETLVLTASQITEVVPEQPAAPVEADPTTPGASLFAEPTVSGVAA